MFWHANSRGLEGIVSKRRDRPYRSGRSADWIKVKNPDVPAFQRIISP
jgi:bifunctional non-homologous end joining protein LigD